MTQPTYSDETLMAYADGELAGEIVADINARLERDEELAARIALFAETRSLAKRASDIDVGVPEALRTSVEQMIASALKRSDPPVPERLPQAANSNSAWWRDYRASAAAALIAVLGAAAGFFAAGFETGQPTTLAVAALTPREIAAPLSNLPSGEKVRLPKLGSEMEIISTFMVGENICREFEVTAGSGKASIAVACASNGQWTTAFAVVTANPSADEFVPASSMEAVEAYLQSISAGVALTGKEEEAALLKTR